MSEEYGLAALKRRSQRTGPARPRGDTLVSILQSIIAQLKAAEADLAPVAAAAAKVTNNTKLTPEVTDTSGKQESEWKAAQNLYAQVLVFGLKQMAKAKSVSVDNPVATQVKQLMGEFSDATNKTVGERFAVGLQMAGLFKTLSQQVSGAKDLITNIRDVLKGSKTLSAEATSKAQDAIKRLQGLLSFIQAAAGGGKTAFDSLKASNPKVAAKIMAMAKPQAPSSTPMVPPFSTTPYVNPYDAAMTENSALTAQTQAMMDATRYASGQISPNTSPYVPELTANIKSYPTYSGAISPGGSSVAVATPDVPPIPPEPPTEPVQQTIPPPAVPQLPSNVAGFGDIVQPSVSIGKRVAVGGVVYLLARAFGVRQPASLAVAGVAAWMLPRD